MDNILQVVDTYEKKHECTQIREYLCMCSLSSLDKFVNWECNREPDEEKVKEIIQSIKQQIHTPQVIFAFLPENSRKYIIWDGGHRMKAMKCMYQSGDREELEKYMKGRFMVSIVKTGDEEYIKKRFTDVNKSTPLPRLYKEPNKDLFTKGYIHMMKNFEKQFRQKYKCHKTSNKPQLPNYNSSAVCDNVDIMIRECQQDLSKVTEQLLLQIFHEINCEFKQFVLENPTYVSAHKKSQADKFDCYIFFFNWEQKFKSKIHKSINGGEVNLIDL